MVPDPAEVLRPAWAGVAGRGRDGVGCVQGLSTQGAEGGAAYGVLLPRGERGRVPQEGDGALCIYSSPGVAVLGGSIDEGGESGGGQEGYSGRWGLDGVGFGQSAKGLAEAS